MLNRREENKIGNKGKFILGDFFKIRQVNKVAKPKTTSQIIRMFFDLQQVDFLSFSYI